MVCCCVCACCNFPVQLKSHHNLVKQTDITARNAWWHELEINTNITSDQTGNEGLEHIYIRQVKKQQQLIMLTMRADVELYNLFLFLFLETIWSEFEPCMLSYICVDVSVYTMGVICVSKTRHIMKACIWLPHTPHYTVSSGNSVPAHPLWVIWYKKDQVKVYMIVLYSIDCWLYSFTRHLWTGTENVETVLKGLRFCDAHGCPGCDIIFQSTEALTWIH